MKRSTNGLQKPTGGPFGFRLLKRRSGSRNRLASVALAVAVTALPFSAGAEDAKPKADFSGTWKIIQYSTNSHEHSPELTLKLKSSDGTLTGTLTDITIAKRKSRAKEWPIKDAKLQGDEISFTVIRPFVSGQKDVASTYHGKISGDTIKGTFNVEVLGQTFTRNWEAARAEDATAITSNED